VNPETGSRSEAMTGTQGEYVLTLLRPGKYQLTISHAGFRTHQRSNIVLEVNEKANIDVRLEVGQATEKVEVTDQAAPISTEATEVGKVIDNTSIQRIPLNGRLNINGLLALAPGIQNAGAQDQVPYYGLTPSAGGAYNYAAVGITLDGMAHSILNADEKWGADRQKWASTASAIKPSADALKNRKVQEAYDSSIKAAREAYLSGSDPTHGAVYSIQLPTPDRSNYAFAKGKPGGVPISTQSGPYHNSFLNKKNMPSTKTWLNTYQDK